jgi:hypothetical protein
MGHKADFAGRAAPVEVRDRINPPSLSIIGPVMQPFEAYLGAATAGRVGAQLRPMPNTSNAWHKPLRLCIQKKHLYHHD